jgi:hypothetical protein
VREILQNREIIFQFQEAYVAEEKNCDNMAINRRDLYILDIEKLLSLLLESKVDKKKFFLYLSSYTKRCRFLHYT